MELPENDPGILAEAFPELVEDSPALNFRAHPDRGLIQDLMDLEVQNHQGVWVPIVPLPIKLLFWRRQCHCGRKFFTNRRYQEHYAYGHIMGMED